MSKLVPISSVHHCPNVLYSLHASSNTSACLGTPMSSGKSPPPHRLCRRLTTGGQLRSIRSPNQWSSSKQKFQTSSSIELVQTSEKPPGLPTLAGKNASPPSGECEAPANRVYAYNPVKRGYVMTNHWRDSRANLRGQGVANSTDRV